MRTSETQAYLDVESYIGQVWRQTRGYSSPSSPDPRSRREHLRRRPSGVYLRVEEPRHLLSSTINTRIVPHDQRAQLQQRVLHSMTLVKSTNE